MIRMGFSSSMQARFRAFKKVVDQRDPEKLEEWVDKDIEAIILDRFLDGSPWTDYWVRKAYIYGAGKAYSEVNKEFASDQPLVFFGGKKQFLQDLAGPEPISQRVRNAAPNLQILLKRVFEELKGVTSAMAQKMARSVADGMTKGESEKQLRNRLRLDIDDITRNRALRLARTEVIRANAQGKLDAYERLGVREVEIEVEWVIVDDDRVCPRCRANAGKIFTLEEIRGLIPLHPECRCEPRIVKRRPGRA